MTKDEAIREIEEYIRDADKATNLLKHGVPIHEVAAILGHDKINTTMEYIVMDDNMIRHDYQKYG